MRRWSASPCTAVKSADAAQIRRVDARGRTAEMLALWERNTHDCHSIAVMPSNVVKMQTKARSLKKCEPTIFHPAEKSEELRAILELLSGDPTRKPGSGPAG
ncbi:hypothetical protein DFH07DRAFT_777786 [Mycena maculata]|uniref:Uncharacterized protein n=1 Tax=Mycena maculata TaxID=230809 RepID=A0AAD7IFS8_9AGAR|nr:hypothetical protein DFH07DRAFT_777786 [Mycena maculata]